jgi:hypothetical protein
VAPFCSAALVHFYSALDTKLDKGAVVTQESDSKRVRIPTVCRKFDVPYKTLFQMNKELDMKL